MGVRSISEKPVVTLCPGPISYDEALAKQMELHQLRCVDKIPDTLLLLEHQPVMTVGLSGGWQFLKVPREFLEGQGIVFRETDRGGKITFHNPGQVVGYPIVKLALHGLSISTFVCRLQEMLIRVLADFGVVAYSRDRIIGVWTRGRKIASLGLRLHHGVTRHGFALNVNNDLTGFQMIDPCGLVGCEITSLQKEGVDLSTTEVESKITGYWQELFEGMIHEVSKETGSGGDSPQRVAQI